MIIRFNNLFIVFLILVLGICGADVLCAKEKYKVVDGDSLEAGRMRIRLIDIDAPELFQECYDENNKSYECGKMALEELKKSVDSGIECNVISVDKYKRKLMDCFDVNGNNVNQNMVLNGWAVAYSDKFTQEESVAREQKIGIWRGRFMRPELYRALHMKQKNNKKFKKR